MTNVESLLNRNELLQKFRAGRTFLPSGCCEKAKCFYACGRILSSRRVAWFIETDRWETRPLYSTCGNPLCIHPRHITTERPRNKNKQIVCWGIEFVSARQLWEHPKCYCHTYNSLTRRLQHMPPEVAARCRYYMLNGKAYRSIKSIPRRVGVSLADLYRRLGCIYGANKCTVAHALHKEWWDEIAPLCRVRDNIYALSTLRPTWQCTDEELTWMMYLDAQHRKLNLAMDPEYKPSEYERLDLTSPYYDVKFACWKQFRAERPYVC